MDANQLREFIIKPTLYKMDPLVPYSEVAVELLMMTAAHESRLGRYLHQINGPAKGMYQHEPATIKDMYWNFMQYRTGLLNSVRQFNITDMADADEIVGNLFLATAYARLHYFRVTEALPNVGDERSMALYAKRYFNTFDGKASAQDYLDAYRELCT